jgi:DNA-binding transcriptional regulator GbsR (MarR family)
MKTTKLIAKMQELLQRPPEEAKLKKLRKAVKALKQKQEDLEDKLRHTKGKHARERLKQKIKVLQAQRRKGAEVYRQLKDELKGPEPSAPETDKPSEPNADS